MERSGHGESNRVLSRAVVQETLTPVGVGGNSLGFGLAKRGEGSYFSQSGGNWGFGSNLIMHKVKGYGFAIMTNAAGGGPLIEEVLRRVRLAYAWDRGATPVPRGYDPPVTTPAVSVPADVLGRYPGRYVGGDLEVTVRHENGVLQTLDGRIPFVALVESSDERRAPS